MTNFLFQRFAELIVTNPQGEAKVFKDLTIKFEIQKSQEENANRATISVFNLSRDNRTFAEENELVVLLKAGFLGLQENQQTIEQIFVGDVSRASTEKVGPDFITTFESGDGEKEQKESVVNTSFAPGVTYGQVIDSITEALGLPARASEDLNRGEKFANGIAVTGSASKKLSEFLRKQELEWSIQDGEIVIKKPEKADDTEIIILNQNTGLLGTPQKREQGRMDFTSLLNPKLSPGKPVRVSSDLANIDGIFICRKVAHSGNTRMASWETRVEAIGG